MMTAQVHVRGEGCVDSLARRRADATREHVEGAVLGEDDGHTRVEHRGGDVVGMCHGARVHIAGSGGVDARHDEVVVTLGGKGSLILYEGKIHQIQSFKPQQIVDATGCGDTYMAGYLYKRSKGMSVQEAGSFGAAMASIKMEDFGPFQGHEAEVMDRIRQ